RPRVGDTRSEFARGAAPEGRRVRDAAACHLVPWRRGGPSILADPALRRVLGQRATSDPNPRQRPTRSRLVLGGGGRRYPPIALDSRNAIPGWRAGRGDELHRRALPAWLRSSGGSRVVITPNRK